MRNTLEQIKRIDTLSIPKSIHSLDDVEFVFGSVAGDTESAWLVSCSHTFNNPASSEEIAVAESKLDLCIPQAYKELLGITNGAHLFCAPRRWLEEVSPGAMHVRFRLFGCQELVHINTGLRESFASAYAEDLEYQDYENVNYVAFCDAEDGNFQALLLDELGDEQVFLLFHEFLYRPYDVRDANFCYRIANSLESWFELIRVSGGWEGRGELTSGL